MELRRNSLADAFADRVVGRLPAKGSWESLTAYGYVLPAVVILAGFQVLPILYVIWLSMHTGTSLFNTPFIGLSDYNRLLHDPEIRASLVATIQFTIATVPVGALLALLLAMLLFEPMRGLAFFRTVVLLPFITPVVATTVVWNWIFNPQYGVLDSALYWLHLPGVNWLASPFWAMFILVAFTLWHEIGFTVLIMLAGLSNLSREVREAARLDGVNWLQEFFHIILPLMSPWIFFVLVVNSIAAFKVFTQVLTITNGGPEHYTELAGFLIFHVAFSYFDLPYASAISVAVLLLVSTLTVAQFLVSRRTVFYQ